MGSALVGNRPESSEKLHKHVGVVAVKYAFDHYVVGIGRGARSKLFPGPEHNVAGFELYASYPLNTRLPNRAQPQFVTKDHALGCNEKQLGGSFSTTSASPSD
eukprot:CAMPEP_0184385936 /NCGR_PEP_ID=MMETSP0007-20130409/9314_1 /TAXON_ID=97485 /ORGANISM="Prymnesium parvum, Strain Texoma1" /LENGTH=102 /DNA_ID=CAMNT_0026733553 /DNA_START=670 /DNA_END=978 /DNA_ORIENTATION=-